MSKTDYKRLGDYIREEDVRNQDLNDEVFKEILEQVGNFKKEK